MNHAHHFGALVVDSGGVEIIYLLIRGWPYRMRHRAGIFRKLVIAQRTHIVDTLNRGFSAPTILNTDLDNAELASLMICDNDPFNRWEASQQLASRIMLAMLERDDSDWQRIQEPLITAYRDLLSRSSLDRALVAMASGFSRYSPLSIQSR